VVGIGGYETQMGKQHRHMKVENIKELITEKMCKM
jgi:hypothetical protein